MTSVRSIIPWLLGTLLSILAGILGWNAWKGWKHAAEIVVHDLQGNMLVWLLVFAMFALGIFVIYVIAR